MRSVMPASARPSCRRETLVLPNALSVLKAELPNAAQPAARALTCDHIVFHRGRSTLLFAGGNDPMLELRSRAAIWISGKRNHGTAAQDAVANLRITGLRRPLEVGQRRNFGLQRKCGACAERWSKDPSGVEEGPGSRREGRSNGNPGDRQRYELARRGLRG